MYEYLVVFTYHCNLSLNLYPNRKQLLFDTLLSASTPLIRSPQYSRRKSPFKKTLVATTPYPIKRKNMTIMLQHLSLGPVASFS